MVRYFGKVTDIVYTDISTVLIATGKLYQRAFYCHLKFCHIYMENDQNIITMDYSICIDTYAHRLRQPNVFIYTFKMKNTKRTVITYNGPVTRKEIGAIM